jgi:formimidoylglutamate deiminase
VVGGQGGMAGGKGGTALVGQLFSVEFDGQAQGFRGVEQAVHLCGREGDRLTKGIDRVDQAVSMGHLHGWNGDFVDIGVSAACIFRRNGMGGKVRDADGQLAQARNLARGAQQGKFTVNAKAIAGLDLYRGGPCGGHGVKAGQGLGKQVAFRCGAGGGDGRQDAATGTGNLGIAGTVQAHLELCRAVTGKDSVGMAVDQAGRDQQVGREAFGKVAECGGDVIGGAGPCNLVAVHGDGAIGDQAVSPDHRGHRGMGQQNGHRTCLMSVHDLIMCRHNRLSSEATMIHAATALLPDGWADGVRVTVDAGRISAVEVGVPGGRGILCPAPVNLHSHTFQRAMAGLTEHRTAGQDSFWTWRTLMYRFLEHLTPDDVQAIAAQVMMEMAEAGYAAVCEFHYLHHGVGGQSYSDLAEMSGRIAAAALETGVGLTHLPVLYEQGGCDGRALRGGQLRFGNDIDGYVRLWESARDALRGLPADTVLGVAPHSLRAVSEAGLQAAATLAPDAPIHMHIAEQVAEVEEVLAYRASRPVAWLLGHADVSARWCLIHATQMEAAETAALAASGAVAGLCPVTESNLGDGIFDGVRYRAAGGRFGVGSDSNVRVSLSEELRVLEYSQRLLHKGRAMLAGAHSTGRTLFDAVCAGGAQAAGRMSGAIRVGEWADLLMLDGTGDLGDRAGDAILDTWIFAGDDRMVREVWSAGRHVVRDGRHVQRDEITAQFRRAMARLKAVL